MPTSGSSCPKKESNFSISLFLASEANSIASGCGEPARAWRSARSPSGRRCGSGSRSARVKASTSACCFLWRPRGKADVPRAGRPMHRGAPAGRRLCVPPSVRAGRTESSRRLESTSMMRHPVRDRRFPCLSNNILLYCLSF
jgi:hypothetical protein